MTKRQIEARIAAAVKRFEGDIQDIANEVRRTRVIPWCDRTGGCFRGGMGTGVMFDRRGASVENRFRSEVLDIEPAAGICGALLGGWMQDYDPKEKP